MANDTPIIPVTTEGNNDENMPEYLKEVLDSNDPKDFEQKEVASNFEFMESLIKEYYDEDLGNEIFEEYKKAYDNGVKEFQSMFELEEAKQYDNGSFSEEEILELKERDKLLLDNYASAKALDALNQYDKDTSDIEEQGNNYRQNKDELIEKNKKENEIREIKANSKKGGNLPLVRGALLKCRKGSHMRYLGLPKCHGIYFRDRPIIYQKDYVVGDNENIRMFGHCSADDPPSDEKVSLIDFDMIDPEGNYLQPIEERTSKGFLCKPSISSEGWMLCNDNIKIAENLDEGSHGKLDSETQGEDEETIYDPIEGRTFHDVVTTESFLYCTHGGIIEPVTSGQEFVSLVYTIEQCDFEYGTPKFYDWCDKYGVNPNYPMTDEYIGDYMNSLSDINNECISAQDELNKNLKNISVSETDSLMPGAPGEYLSKVNELREEANRLYNQMLGEVLSSCDGDISTLTDEQRNGLDKIRYQYNEIPCFEDGIYTGSQSLEEDFQRHSEQYGSNTQTVTE